jgi:hypothetical protein
MRKKVEKKVVETKAGPKLPRLSTGGMLLPAAPVLPSTHGERISPLERARGVGTNEPGNPIAPPRRVIGPHGLPPAGLDKKERSIWFTEGWGSIESRRGVLWDREYHRRLKIEGQRSDTEKAERFGVDVTPADARPMRELPWFIHGVVWNPRAT